MNFGPQTSEADSFGIMDATLEQGSTFFDTASLGMGQTEQIIEHWVAQGSRRERIVLATKAHGPLGSGPNDRGLSAYHIRKACEDSLRRLQTDHIGLYQMHHIERSTPFEEIWQARLRQPMNGDGSVAAGLDLPRPVPFGHLIDRREHPG